MTRFTIFSLAVVFFASSVQAQENKVEPEKGKLKMPSFIELKTDPPQTDPPAKLKKGETDPQKVIVVYLPNTKTKAKMPNALMAGDFPLPSGYQRPVEISNSPRNVPSPTGKSKYQPEKPQTLRKPSFGRFPSNYRK